MVQDASYRGWIFLNKEEIGLDIYTVADAISNYDAILKEVKSWPSIPSGLRRSVGRFAECRSEI
jgi:hypothetical protein